MDGIDKAIADTEKVSERRIRMVHKLPTGRDLIVDVPADMSLDEFRATVGFVAADMPREMVKSAASSPAEPIVDRVAQLRRLKVAGSN